MLECVSGLAVSVSWVMSRLRAAEAAVIAATTAVCGCCRLPDGSVTWAHQEEVDNLSSELYTDTC